MFSTFMKKAAIIVALMALLAVAASAQSTQIEGTVKVKAPDGTKKPVPGAQVDMYRMDIKGQFHLKADKNGHFISLGIPVQGTFLIVVSGPNCQPTWMNDIRAGQLPPQFDVDLLPGDGSVPTYEQAMAALKGGGSGSTGPTGPSAADKARMDAAAKERAAKIEEGKALQATLDEAIKHFKQGADFKTASNYEGALTEFEQAAAVDPGKHKAFVEVAYKSNAQIAETHYQLGADLFNKKQRDAAKPHFQKGHDAAKKAIALAATITDDPNINNELLVYYGILGKNAGLLVELYGVTEVIDEAALSLDKAATLDTPANKGKWVVLKAKMYFNAGRTDEAMAAYKEVLQGDANNIDALFGLGLTLVASGEKAKVQEGVNYLADFISKAPATDKRVADVKSQLDDLKKQQQVEPEKPAKRRRP